MWRAEYLLTDDPRREETSDALTVPAAEAEAQKNSLGGQDIAVDQPISGWPYRDLCWPPSR